MEVARHLGEQGFAVNFHYLGAQFDETDQVRRVVNEHLTLLDALTAENFNAGVALQLSLLGLGISESLATENLLLIARKAAESGRRVRIDMESAEWTARILDVVRRASRESPNIGTVVQAFLKRSNEDIDKLNQEKIPVVLVKGSHLEPQEGAFKDPEEIALFFMRLIETLMRDGSSPAIATHDEKLIEFAIDIAFIFGLDQADYEFQMLFGIRNDLAEKLLADGYRVRITLPYGDNWYPYFMRRLAERPINLWRLLRDSRREVLKDPLPES
ncbi:proline dehydrogenase [Desulfuromonas versatilis]|uniref:Proline dehydrogenase n=2 Tax=Desulfuromonas versatilis TaxID=2802975 RepID=A0ABM8HR63_9BACT|nr:proline dehydrogenase [Desulfuromonas versatilis]